MTAYYKVLGGHTHIRVFVNGAKSGDLCVRNYEFEALRAAMSGLAWIPDKP